MRLAVLLGLGLVMLVRVQGIRHTLTLDRLYQQLGGDSLFCGDSVCPFRDGVCCNNDSCCPKNHECVLSDGKSACRVPDDEDGDEEEEIENEEVPGYEWSNTASEKLHILESLKTENNLLAGLLNIPWPVVREVKGDVDETIHKYILSNSDFHSQLQNHGDEPNEEE